MKSRVFMLVASLLVIAAAVDRASACDCGPGLVSDAFVQSDIVFAGRVAEISREALEPTRVGDREFPNTLLWAKFVVEERFKGVDGSAVIVSPGEENSTCSVKLEVGTSYLVFATRSPADGRLMTSNCTQTLSVDRSAANLAYCRYRARTGTEPRLIGSVSEQSSPTLLGSRRETHPVEGIAVTLEGEGRKFGTLSDRNGVYLLDNIPNGAYTLRFALPDGCRTLQFWTSSRDGQSDSSENLVTIDDRGLAASILVTSSGGLVGRLVDSSGRPLEGITMHAIPKERTGNMQPNEQFPTSFSSASGEFDFGVLSDGEYALLVAWTDMPPDVGRPPFPSYWYASPSNPECTAVFVVKKGRLIDLGEVKAPPVPKYVVIEVKLVNAKGDLEIGLIECQREDGGIVGYAMIDGEREKTQVFLPVGSRYRLIARLGEDPSADVAEPLLVDPAKPPREIKFVAVMPEEP